MERAPYAIMNNKSTPKISIIISTLETVRLSNIVAQNVVVIEILIKQVPNKTTDDNLSY